MKKIEIGGGKWPHEGYTHIDIEPENKPDIVGDFRTMTFSELEEIRSHHLLEHFNRDEAITILKLWHSWLKPKGTLIIETPDFEGICRDFLINTENVSVDFSGLTRYWMTRHAFGSQEKEWAFHKDGWYEEKFRRILPQIGFKITLIKKKKSRVIIKKEEINERYVLPNILVIAEKI